MFFKIWSMTNCVNSISTLKKKRGKSSPIYIYKHHYMKSAVVILHILNSSLLLLKVAEFQLDALTHGNTSVLSSM